MGTILFIAAIAIAIYLLFLDGKEKRDAKEFHASAAEREKQLKEESRNNKNAAIRRNAAIKRNLS